MGVLDVRTIKIKDDQAAPVGNATEAFERALWKRDEQFFHLRLFVSGMTPNSSKAIANVKKICREQLAGRHELEIIDVYQQPLFAKEGQIVAVPTLVKLLPLPTRKFIGDMSQTERVLHWLGLEAKKADDRSPETLLAENEELRRRLEETEVLQLAIQCGEVDALVVSRPEGEQVFTLQGAEHPYRVLIETMNEGAATLAPDGSILYCNRRLAAMLHVPLEKLIGSPLVPYLDPADHPLFAARLENCAMESDKEEISLIIGEGNRMPVLFSCAAVDLAGCHGVSVVLTDIGARKQTELLRREAEEALQRETAERLRVVEELHQNERLLFQQNRQAALGEMIGNIAHQWRQPLNALGLLVQQASLFYEIGEASPEFLENNLNRSMDLVYHMSRTIDDFGNFFKPDKEKVEFKAREVVAKSLFLLEGSLDGQDIGIEVQVKGDPSINGYLNEFSQVLLNILLNARDALTERKVASPRVVISIGRKKGRTVVTIADNAGGIPEEILDKVFDPYFTTKGPQSGTGVGLFMSKTIIEKNMGGLLTVRNIEGGAEFRIEV
jgi:PAS domain S-box-containing protein